MVRIIKSAEVDQANIQNLAFMIKPSLNNSKVEVNVEAENAIEPKPLIKELRDPETIINKAKLKAQNIVEKAQLFSDNHMKEATKKAEDLFNKSKEKGYDEGFNKGFSEGHSKGVVEGQAKGYEDGMNASVKENKKALNSIYDTIEKLEMSYEQTLLEFQGDIQSLCFAIAKSIIKSELSISPEKMNNIIMSALDEYKNQKSLKVTISKQTFDSLVDIDNNFIKNISIISPDAKVICDESIDEFDCLIETDDSLIDLGINTQLDNISEALNVKNEYK